MKIWKDIKGKEIKAGDKLFNDWNEPKVLEVLTDGKQLFLGDMETPFDERYGFHNFWLIVD